MVEETAAGLRTLYRPVGLREMVRILEAESRAFPPRRPEQPTFYPVLSCEYAAQIAREWNAPSASAGYVGFVTAFHIDVDYAARFEEHVVGAAMHRELWVPAEELEEFNRHLADPIALVEAYCGDAYVGPDPLPAALRGLPARRQLLMLARMLEDATLDFRMGVGAQRILMQLNFAYWVRGDFTAEGIAGERKITVLRAIRTALLDRMPDLRLLGSDELDALDM